MAAGATRAPDDATRSFDTAEGRLSYGQLAERLAEPLQTIDLRIRQGEYAASALDEALLLSFHGALASVLFPDDAGRYRKKAVQVGVHLPPDAHLVPRRMRDYVDNIAERLLHLRGEAGELLLEFLAYAEGELLSIHPFPDLNGRVSRLWLTELLRRLHLPPVDVVPPGAAFRARYLSALSAADERDWKPLMALWKERLSQPAGLHEIALLGCTPTPLASYLKALAVLRLVAEAGEEGGGDAEATGFWRDDVFVLRTRLTAEQLVAFFLERYRPTPLIAPWNAGSGFYFQEGKLKGKNVASGKKLKTGTRNQHTKATRSIAAIEQSTSNRFLDYKIAIGIARQVIAKFERAEAPENSPSIKLKDRFILAFRNVAPDRCLEAMDSVVLLTGADTTYPPLLGTGGNDGNLDFTNNFIQRLISVVNLDSGKAAPRSRESLVSALFCTAVTTQSRGVIGQFHPGVAGGPNASSGFQGSAKSNVWNFILMLEGAMMFAASAVRRLESGDQSVLSAPFLVRGRMGTEGAGNAIDDNDCRDEIWMPLWSAACRLDEVRYVLGEGRATVNTRSARDGLDFRRAIAQLGVSRGIGSFQRYGFFKRQGNNFLAVPLSRVAVSRNVDADLIVDLERHSWLGCIQRYARDDNAPNAFRSAARQLDRALFAMTERTSRQAVQMVLSHIGRIDAALHRSKKSRKVVLAPTPQLSTAWAASADDASAEFGIASALAGLCFHDASGKSVLHTRRHLVAVGEAVNRQGDRAWEPMSPAAAWGAASLAGNLRALLQRRRLEAIALGAEGELLASRTGATRNDLAAFLKGRTDDARIAALLSGLACVDLQRRERPPAHGSVPLPPAFAILKIFFTPESVLRALQWLPADRTLRLPAELAARLAADDVQAALRLAWQRLRAIGVGLPGRSPPEVVGADGPRWLAALCVPLAYGETAQMLHGLPFANEAAHRSLDHLSD